MKFFYFFFGRTPDFSFVELASLTPNVEKVSDTIARIALTDKEAANSLFGRLGGCLKFSEQVGSINKSDDKALLSFIEDHTLFSLSVIGSSENANHELLSAIKVQLKQIGKKCRYIAPHDAWGVSSAAFRDSLYELLLIPIGDKYEVTVTCSVQDIYRWSHRDYGRPFADAKNGMLPPKVARMAVNIALGRYSSEKEVRILDPFCGMGTILGEALMLGCEVVGSDIQDTITQKAKANIIWLANQFSLSAKFQFTVQDATHISENVSKDSIDIIVTEPFMGSSQLGERTMSVKQIANTIKGLEKLYIGCLREWTKVLRPNGFIMIALPSVSFGHREFFVKRVIDTCENLGYTTVLGPIGYNRPQAIVKRNFYLFQKTTK